MSEHALVSVAGILVLGVGAQWLASRLRLPSILLLIFEAVRASGPDAAATLVVGAVVGTLGAGILVFSLRRYWIPNTLLTCLNQGGMITLQSIDKYTVKSVQLRTNLTPPAGVSR